MLWTHTDIRRADVRCGLTDVEHLFRLIIMTFKLYG